MKIQITGASDWVNRMFTACGQFQWAREFLQNSLEAGASKVEFGIEWSAVQRLGVYRRCIVDNGKGMNADELEKYFSTLGAGEKKRGGVHDNFGIGSKVSSLPWNPNGLVVISRKDGVDSMIKIELDPSDGDYRLFAWPTEDGLKCVINPKDFDWPPETGEPDWSSVFPEWVEKSGTAVVLLGSDLHPDTILGNPEAGEQVSHSLTRYLNTRFWDVSNAEVKVVEVNHKDKSNWPTSPNPWDPAIKPHVRNVTGAKYFAQEITLEYGELEDSGIVALADGKLLAHYYLWKGERPQVSHYAQENGYIAVKYKNELFELTNSKSDFRPFGIIEAKVQKRVTIVLEPQHFVPGQCDWGIFPDQSRARLNFSARGVRGSAIPLTEWGQEFSTKLPPKIWNAICEARSEVAGQFNDEEYRKRLQDKFGNRWKMPGYYVPKTASQDGKPVLIVTEDASDLKSSKGNASESAEKSKVTPLLVKKSAAVEDKNGQSTGKPKDKKGDVPRFKFAPKDDFEKPWHLAMWAPHAPEGPTVVLNRDADLLEESIRHFSNQYAPVYAEEVQKVVLQCYGEIAACKLAHSQRLKSVVPLEELNKTYRSEEALTIALMGLVAEEAVIAKRLRYLGRRLDSVSSVDALAK